MRRLAAFLKVLCWSSFVVRSMFFLASVQLRLSRSDLLDERREVQLLLPSSEAVRANFDRGGVSHSCFWCGICMMQESTLLSHSKLCVDRLFLLTSPPCSTSRSRTAFDSAWYAWLMAIWIWAILNEPRATSLSVNKQQQQSIVDVKKPVVTLVEEKGSNGTISILSPRSHRYSDYFTRSTNITT